MSVIYFRDAVLKRLQDRVDALTQRAVDARATNFPSADVFALTQTDTLAEARALAEAHRIVREEYKRTTEGPPEQPVPEEPAKKAEDVY